VGAVHTERLLDFLGTSCLQGFETKSIREFSFESSAEEKKRNTLLAFLAARKELTKNSPKKSFGLLVRRT